MKEMGFMPFSVVGVFLVVLVLGMAGHSAWARHQRATETIGGSEASELRKIMEEVQANLRSALKRSVQRALVDVCEGAQDFNDDERRTEIEIAAANNFSDEISALADAYSANDGRVRVEISAERPIVWISETENGFAVANGMMPRNSHLILKSLNNSLETECSLGLVRTFVDSRYFLLQDRMNDFIENKGTVNDVWGVMEYLRGWGEAWVGGHVHLDNKIDRALFQAAWSVHEYSSFGSCDYWGAALDLADAAKDVLAGKVVVSPIDGSDVAEMKKFVGGSLDEVAGAEKNLDNVLIVLREAGDALLENLPFENFRRILSDAAENIAGAILKIGKAEEKFSALLGYVLKKSDNDVMMYSIFDGLTGRLLDNDLPSPKEQVGWCVQGIRDALSEIENEIENLSGEAMECAENILGAIRGKIENLRATPVATGQVVLESYDEGSLEKTENLVPVYVTENSGKTISSVKNVFDGLAQNLDELLRLPEKMGIKENVEIPGLDGILREKLTADPLEINFDRENFYKILPPTPISENPGISVYHELDIENVKHERGDITGRLGLSEATPIPLPFLNITIYWGQWKTTVCLGDSVEEVLDFENPTALVQSNLGQIHGPLAYRWEIPDNKFGVEVVVLSLRPFRIG